MKHDTMIHLALLGMIVTLWFFYLSTGGAY